MSPAAHLPGVRQIAAQVNAGACPVAIVEAALQRAEADQLNAVIRVYRDSALATAAEVAQRVATGASLPLAGVPVLLKDNICYQGHPVEACSRILTGFVAPYHATVVERLLAAGAVIIGAANMDSFAMGSSNETSCHGPVRNPHDPNRVPGGSSGGSAAAVAAGIVPLALGSDTGGSIRQPAAFCGTLGCKPTYGRVSRYGLLAFGSSLDQIGPLCRDAADAALALAVISGHDPLDSTSSPLPAVAAAPTARALAGLRIGMLELPDEGLDPAISATLTRARQALEAAGASLVPVRLPHDRHAVACYYIIATGEAASNLSRYDGIHYGHRCQDPADLEEVYARSRAEGFGAEVQRRIMLGTYVLSAGYLDAYYLKAQRVRRLLVQDYATAFAACDVILGPTTPTPAFALGEKIDDPLQMYLNDIFTIGANLAGVPALSLPAGHTDKGLPIGLHLQGPHGQDEALLGIAAAVAAVL